MALTRISTFTPGFYDTGKSQVWPFNERSTWDEVETWVKGRGPAADITMWDTPAQARAKGADWLQTYQPETWNAVKDLPAYQPLFSTPGAGGGTTGSSSASGGLAAAGGASSGNPYTTIRNVKDPLRQEALDTQLGDIGERKERYDTLFDGLQDEHGASRKRTGDYMSEEAKAMTRFYDGSIQSDLDAIMQRRTKAMNDITGRLRSEMYGADAAAALARGGGASSYRNRVMDQALTKLYQQEALDRTNQEMNNLQWLEANKQALLGRRANAERAYIDSGADVARMRLPFEQSLDDTMRANVNASLMNNFFGVYRQYEPSATTYTGLPNYARYGVPQYGIDPSLLAALAYGGGGSGDRYYPSMYSQPAQSRVTGTPVSVQQPTTSYMVDQYNNPFLYETPSLPSLYYNQPIPDLTPNPLVDQYNNPFLYSEPAYPNVYYSPDLPDLVRSGW